MTEKEIIQFEKTQSQLKELYTEIGLLLNQNPAYPIRKFKLNLINQVINESNELLGNKYKPFSGFDKFDVESVFTVSDVSLVLKQYLICLERLRCDNISSRGSYCYWLINGETSNIKAKHPVDFTR